MCCMCACVRVCVCSRVTDNVFCAIASPDRIDSAYIFFRTFKILVAASMYGTSTCTMTCA